VTRLLLIRHAPTDATERGAFAGDEPITDDGRRAASRLRGRLPAADAVLCSPALRCRQTAEALGLHPAVDPALAECRFGEWEGRTFAEIGEREPDLLGGWLRDPAAAPPGGESLAEFARRVDGWLALRAGGNPGTVLAVTHAGVIRAAVVGALGAPIEAFWRVMAAPLSITELEAHDGQWTLARLNWTADA
jgi:broad specificity phosphatase PhoE